MQAILLLVLITIAHAVPYLEPTQCPKFTYTQGRFIKTDASGPALQSTIVGVCKSETHLNFTFVAVDNNIESKFTHCNEPLYEQDVVEVFIAPGHEKEVLKDYLEFEVSPHGALFASHIHNPNGVCKGISGKLIDCDTSGIHYGAKLISSGFSAVLNIPLKMIFGSAPPKGLVRTNFFRIDRVKNQTHQEFSCWSTTHTNPPCFHVPK
jgi:hypothetical protein